MKAIIITEDTFEAEFQATLDKLKLELFEATPEQAADRAIGTPLGDLHRKFHYEIAKLQARLRNS